MKRFRNEEAHTIVIEYALMAGLIGVAIASAVGPVSTILSSIIFTEVAGRPAINSAVFLLILLAFMLAAAVTDLRKCKIPNWITMSAMASGLLGHAFIDGIPGTLFSLKGLGLGFTLFLLVYVLGGMGAGDVKMLAAGGSFIGPEGVLSAGLLAMLLGGLYAIAIMISHWGVRGTLTQMAMILKTWVLAPRSFGKFTSAETQPQLRYGLVIGLGILVSQWLDPLFFTF